MKCQPPGLPTTQLNFEHNSSLLKLMKSAGPQDITLCF